MSRDRSGALQRPSLTGTGTLAEIEEVLAKRLPVYGAVADVVVDTAGKDSAGIAAEIAGRLEDDLMDAEKKRKRRRLHVR